MFTKESLYINAIKYDTQFKLDYKKLSNNELLQSNNSVFLVSEDILPQDIAHKINTSQSEIDETYISTLLISDTTRLVPKAKSSKLKDCEIASFNDEYDIVVLKTTLFETKNFFLKTGIDYIYSAFHIMNLHLEQNVSKNELLVFLLNSKAFILIINKIGSIVYHKIEDLPTFETVKKTHFYGDDIDGQKLFDEIYYLELNEIIHNTLNRYYEDKKEEFVEKITILYNLKQLTNEQIEHLSQEMLIKVNYHPINIDEEVYELSKDKHQKKSFIKPRKKTKKTNYTNYFIYIALLLACFGVFKFYEYISSPEPQSQEVQGSKKSVSLPDHININDKIDKRLKAVFEAIAYDVVLKELKIDSNTLFLKATFLKENTFITSLKPNLDKLYEKNEFTLIKGDSKIGVEGSVSSKNELDLNLKYNVNKEPYIVDEFMPIGRVTEQLKTIMPQDTIIKFKSSKNEEVTKFYYMVNTIVASPKELFSVIEKLNKELYSVNIVYPINMTKTINGIEIEFNLVFNQPKQP